MHTTGDRVWNERAGCRSIAISTSKTSTNSSLGTKTNLQIPKPQQLLKSNAQSTANFHQACRSSLTQDSDYDTLAPTLRNPGHVTPTSSHVTAATPTVPYACTNLVGRNLRLQNTQLRKNSKNSSAITDTGTADRVHPKPLAAFSMPSTLQFPQKKILNRSSSSG